MENEQKTQNNYQPEPQRKSISVGAALILGISGIIIAAIIAGAIIFSSGAKALDNIDFKELDGLQVQVNEQGNETSVNVDIKETQREPSYTNTDLGFSIVLPVGVTAGAVQQSEGGPWRSISFSDGTRIQVTSNIAWDNEYGSFPINGSPITLGENTFYTSSAMGQKTTYGIEKNGVRYEIFQDSNHQIDLGTFQIISL
jgi:hypothetical protein